MGPRGLDEGGRGGFVGASEMSVLWVTVECLSDCSQWQYTTPVRGGGDTTDHSFLRRGTLASQIRELRPY